jgi:hypothetical protein
MTLTLNSIDSCTKSPKGLTSVKSQAYGPAKMKMLVDLQSRVRGPLVCGSNGAIWPGLAGTQIQNWGKSGKYSTREIPMLQRAVAAGVLFEARECRLCPACLQPRWYHVHSRGGGGEVAAGLPRRMSAALRRPRLTPKID